MEKMVTFDELRDKADRLLQKAAQEGVDAAVEGRKPLLVIAAGAGIGLFGLGWWLGRRSQSPPVAPQHQPCSSKEKTAAPAQKCDNIATVVPALLQSAAVTALNHLLERSIGKSSPPTSSSPPE